VEARPQYYTRQLNAMSSNLLTMDIPIDLNYSWTDRLYSSIGVSYLGVLSENRTYHFIDKINEPMFAGDGANLGEKDINYSVKASYVDERAAERPLDGKGYAGFLNFSIGHKTPVSKRFSISVEPFFKLPIGKLAKEDMNLTNGGIRIVTGF